MSDETAAALKEVQQELRVLSLEMRAGFAEQRTRDAETRAYLGQMFDAITELRNDFESHGPHDS